MSDEEPFLPQAFDEWAQAYDGDVASQHVFPFAGYQQVLQTVVELAAPRPGMSLLDLGTGTGNLALRFAERGCELWCTDFSEAMLAKARRKLTGARFVLQDLRAGWPAALDRSFDRIVSAYVFHHFDLQTKVALCQQLIDQRLAPSGRLVIADISFPNEKAMHEFARSVGDLWEQEPYWLADQAIAALEGAGLQPRYVQVSACAGVYAFTT